MRVLINPVFLGGSILYILVKVCQYYDVTLNTFVDNHLTDLICIPVVLYIIRMLMLQFKAFREHAGGELSILAILLVTIYFSVYFEYYLPTTSSIYTGDIVDVFMYFLGAAIFSLSQRYWKYQRTRKLK